METGGASRKNTETKQMEKVGHLEALLFAAVLETCVDQLEILGYIMPVSDEEKTDLSHTGIQKIKEIIETQKELDINDSELMSARQESEETVTSMALKNTGHEQQTRKTEDGKSTHQPSKTGRKHSALTAEKLRKIEADRQYASDVITVTMKKIQESGIFNSLTEANEREKEKKSKFYDVLIREEEGKKEIKSLQKQLQDVKRQTTKELQEMHQWSVLGNVLNKYTHPLVHVSTGEMHQVIPVKGTRFVMVLSFYMTSSHCWQSPKERSGTQSWCTRSKPDSRGAGLSPGVLLPRGPAPSAAAPHQLSPTVAGIEDSTLMSSQISSPEIYCISYESVPCPGGDLCYDKPERNRDKIIDCLKEKLQEKTAKLDTESSYMKKDTDLQIHQTQKKCSKEENALNKEIQNLKNRTDEEIQLHRETENFLRQQYEKVEEKLEYWMEKYENDTNAKEVELDDLRALKAENLETMQKFAKECLMFEETIITDRTEKKTRREQREQEALELKSALKLQAWWKGMMVRRFLGPYQALEKLLKEQTAVQTDTEKEKSGGKKK